MDLAIIGAGLGLGLSYVAAFIFLVLGLIFLFFKAVYTIVYLLITGIDPNTGKPPRNARKKPTDKPIEIP
jgi:hypothetical protein